MTRATAIKLIQEAVADGRYELTRHFLERLDERFLFWPDVLGIVNQPTRVTPAGDDDDGRPKFKLAGQTSAGGAELVRAIAFSRPEDGEQVVVVHGTAESFAFEAGLEARFAFEQAQGQAAEAGEVFGGVSLTHPAVVFAEGDVQ